MACPEFSNIYTSMSRDLGNKLSGYHTGLQARYGDPRVYAMQRDEMARDEATVMHARAKKTSDLMQGAYERQKERNRETHHTRIRSRLGQSSASHPESAQPTRRTRRPPAAAGPSSAPGPSAARR